MIGKAVSLSDAISKTDGVPAKIKEIMSNIKIAHVTEEVSRAMDKMNSEIARSSVEHRLESRQRRVKTAEERRERYLVKGALKLFGGGGLTIFLYFLAHALTLKLSPDFLARIPFEVDPVVHVMWLVGLIPMLSGLGHIIAGLSIRRDPAKQVESPEQLPLRIDAPASGGNQYVPEQRVTSSREAPASVTDRTTNILDRDPTQRATQRS
ncbi:MAG: hypothetical protein ACMG6H_13525 [Acidobacteriota bacterium]